MRRKILVSTLLVVSGVCLLHAQTDAGRIVGTVSDASGAVVPNAVLTVVNEKTGQVRKLMADSAGYFVVPNLPAPSTYKITAQAASLGPSEYAGIPISVGQERVLNITVSPATVATEVQVSGGDLTVIDVSSAEVGANVNSREVGQLPLNGRQLSQLYLLAPGAQTAGGGSFDNIRFSGRANQQNEVRFDGIEGSSIIDSSPGNLDGEISTGFRLQASLENVAEFQVQSSNYPAEYGTGTAGQISVVTKSGGNELHGGLFEYLRKTIPKAIQIVSRGGGLAPKPVRPQKIAMQRMHRLSFVHSPPTLPRGAPSSHPTDDSPDKTVPMATGGAISRD